MSLGVANLDRYSLSGYDVYRRTTHAQNFGARSLSTNGPCVWFQGTLIPKPPHMCP